MKPHYLTPECASELIPAGMVNGYLLCPHCRHVLYVGEKPGPSGKPPKPRKPSSKGASRAQPPK